MKARDRGRRLGSLLYNAGGPGAPGVVDVADGSWTAGEKARTRYDLVGLDPRGLGASAPISCSGKEPAQPEEPPRTVADAKKAFAGAREFARSCQRGSGKVLAHMDSASVARDLDVLRSVLGDDKLDYTGISYGTFFGQQYRKLFPDRAGRMVLDGVVNPARDMRQVVLLDVRTTEEALRRCADDLVARGDLRLGATGREIVQRITDLVADLERAPLEGPGDRRLTGATVSGYLRTVTNREHWGQLTDDLLAAMNGDAGAFDHMEEEGAAGAGEEGGGDEKPTPQQEKAERTEDIGNPAVLCLDSRGAPKSPQDMLHVADEFARKSPLFGRAFAWQMLDCATWPIAPTGKVEPIEAAGAPPVLLVSYTTGDPQTPLENAQAVNRQLANSSLLVRKGQGHGAYASQTPSACTDRAVDACLVDGNPPEKIANRPSRGRR
ncbi:hypothetical protein AV521_36970 [Streptomyces sp. IMTB 2501]|uniref:alpha/beta hydrolase n=1 Tax=Streptomyces sp. IMTB 2501 TaxID=1776340 RepID=UPI00096D70E0|nr:alpha/beta hydrolase [Streptomyces sp. IMTB 2501]OLZ64115.1 hypothetical protein AV521_36970 [Streptomyces sp. IMTB 2501]